MSSPTISPAAVSDARLELVAFWRQLSEVNSTIASLERQAREIRMQRFQLRASTGYPDEADHLLQSLATFLQAQAKQLDATRGTLEDIRDFLRISINKRVRPTLRPLSILNLPDELLIRIFWYVKGGLDDNELYFFDHVVGHVGRVKALRQVCRRFHDTSSHLLLHYVTVDMTGPSIAHLEEISRHPVISKGIRAIQVILCFYDSALAGDIRAFAAYQASRLRSSISSWQFAIDHPLDLTGTPVVPFAAAIARALPIAESWEDAATDTPRDDSANYRLLRRAHEQYIQCYVDETILRQGTFVSAIASAMARMPRATWLQFYERDDWRPRLTDTVILPEDVDDHELLLGKLSTPVMSWKDVRVHGLGDPPAEVIPRLLLALHEEGVPLTGLEIWTPPPEDLSVLVTDRNRLEAAVQHLRVLSYRPRQIYHEDGFWASRATEEWTPFREFLSGLLSSTSLQRVSLELDFLCSEEDAPLFSIGQVVSSQCWPKLGSLSFCGPFHLAELRCIIRRAEKGLYLQWTGELMSGSWAEVLDLMREGVSREVLEYNSGIETMNGHASGQEWDHMTIRESQYIFCKQYLPEVRESRAAGYIRDWIRSNPVRDWERGDLVIPEDVSLSIAP